MFLRYKEIECVPWISNYIDTQRCELEHQQPLYLTAGWGATVRAADDLTKQIRGGTSSRTNVVGCRSSVLSTTPHSSDWKIFIKFPLSHFVFHYFSLSLSKYIHPYICILVWRFEIYNSASFIVVCASGRLFVASNLTDIWHLKRKTHTWTHTYTHTHATMTGDKRDIEKESWEYMRMSYNSSHRILIFTQLWIKLYLL